MDYILNEEKDLKVQVFGINLQNDYVNCGVFCIELVKHLGEDEIRNILQKTTELYSEDFFRQGNCCCNIRCNMDEHLPVALVSYKQSLSKEMAGFLEMKNNILKDDGKDKKEVHETEDRKIARKIVYSYGFDNYDNLLKVNARADQKRQTIQWYYDKEQSEKNNGLINQDEKEKNCLFFNQIAGYCLAIYIFLLSLIATAG